MVGELRKRKAVREADVLDPRRPRLVLPGKRPLSCQR